MSQSKKTSGSRSPASSLENAIRRMKEEIRVWYGTLSVKELVCNRSLVAEIEKLERLLASQVVI